MTSTSSSARLVPIYLGGVCWGTLIVVFGLFLGCAIPGERALSQKEAASYGLTGVIYDSPLCPTKFEKGKQVISGKCEYVTCKPVGTRLRCVAHRKKP